MAGSLNARDSTGLLCPSNCPTASAVPSDRYTRIAGESASATATRPCQMIKRKLCSVIVSLLRYCFDPEGHVGVPESAQCPRDWRADNAPHQSPPPLAVTEGRAMRTESYTRRSERHI